MPLSIEWVRQRLLAAYDAKPTIDPILSIGDRIHSFRIVAGHGSVIPAFMTWLNCPLDRLQDLRLEWLAGSKPDNFVRCRTPTLHGTSGFWALRKLHLNGVGMLDWDWAAGVLNNLQSLHLKYAGLSYAIFARLLQSSAKTLEYVHLEDAFSRRRAFDEEDEEEPAPWEPLQAPEIRLARLRELCMRGDVYTPNDGPSMNILVPLSYLSIPETTQLLLTCRIITSEELLQSAGILPPSLFRSGPLLKITELMVVLHGYGGFTFKGTVDPDLNYYTIEVGLHHSTSYPDLSSYPDLLSHPNAFADMFGQSPIHTLTVLYNPVTFALEMGHWMELCGLEGLRCLRIAPLYQQPNFQDLEGMSHVFRVLAQGVGPKQDQRRVPRLQRVDLIYFDTGPQFLAFARACLKKRMEGRDCDPLSVWSDGIPVLGPDSESTPGDDDGDIYDTKPGPE
ncbi:hypothetical protein EUX98_g6822 [Antrodiella citrinella]|uniref:Uncharacterized protein n=1 Tax=Antrodiella citrinella TaxID=2447956 RepID=A0A4S4MNV3_9APHY|nr:hypothetical protein EUX98_g6822 [Antrodiella citrinella]